MKKIMLSLALLLLIITFGFAASYHHYGHTVKCAKCVEESKKDPGIFINVAWRTAEPYKKEGDKVYALYHCYGGHYYWAEID